MRKIIETSSRSVVKEVEGGPPRSPICREEKRDCQPVQCLQGANQRATESITRPDRRGIMAIYSLRRGKVELSGLKKDGEICNYTYRGMCSLNGGGKEGHKGPENGDTTLFYTVRHRALGGHGNLDTQGVPLPGSLQGPMFLRCPGSLLVGCISSVFYESFSHIH